MLGDGDKENLSQRSAAESDMNMFSSRSERAKKLAAKSGTNTPLETIPEESQKKKVPDSKTILKATDMQKQLGTELKLQV